MKSLVIVGEGQTEEAFVTRVLRAPFVESNVLVDPRLVGGRGGALKGQRVLRYLRNTLRERPDTVVTTFFDLYRLPSDFPGVEESRGVAAPLDRASAIEAALKAAVVEVSGCREDRFVPYIQPHEFEALLFSDVAKFGEVEKEWQPRVAQLQRVRDAVPTPEHINHGADTHPSARLATLSPKFQKTLHGILLAEEIGLATIRTQCAHFDSWIAALLALGSNEDEGADPQQ
ncbi:MAG: DUF4276 family protein [Vicinamibacterales bacterium]